MRTELITAVIVINLVHLIVVLVALSIFSKRASGFTGVAEWIQGQFRAESGTSMRDVLNRLEQSAEDNRKAVRDLRASVQSLAAQVEVGSATGLRIEHQAEGVADRLTESQCRADAVDIDADPGMASDAASRGEC